MYLEASCWVNAKEPKRFFKKEKEEEKYPVMGKKIRVSCPQEQRKKAWSRW